MQGRFLSVTLIHAIAILNYNVLGYSGNLLSKSLNSRVSLKNSIQVPVAKDANAPIVNKRNGLVFKKWDRDGKEGVYTSKVTFNEKPAFLKCMKKEDSYKKELDVLSRIQKGIAITSSKECSKLGNSMNYFLQQYDTFVTSNAYNCIVLSSEKDITDLREYIETTPMITRYEHAAHIFEQILASVAYLHCVDIAHTDIKPETHVLQAQGFCGPETFIRETHREALYNPVPIKLCLADSWAIAATMYAFFNHISPYEEYILADGNISYMSYKKSRRILIDVYQTNEHRCLPLNIPHELEEYAAVAGIYDLREFMSDLMMPSPEDRQTPIQLLQHSVLPSL
ncbi:kinase-like domain-containing protein [Syncephalis fuscata]|nr:kinase-like domain-containing protein [Syncephalis fuscata]